MNENAFVSYLKELAQRDDRGALAALRRGLGRPPGSVAEMHPYVAPFLSDGPWTWRHQCHYVLGSLFAMCPQSAIKGNLGDTIREVVRRAGGDSIDGRFVALLKCHRDDLFDNLRHAVSLAGSKDVPICWETLFSDIQHWDDDRGYVQRNWSRSFWGAAEAATASTSSTNEKGE